MTTHRSVLDRAKQGEPDAIADLMNRTLSKQSSRVQVRQRGHEYCFLVESARQVPNQQSTVNWIKQGLISLTIPHIQQVTVYGKLKTDPKPAWQFSFRLEGAPQERNQLPKQPINQSPEHNQSPENTDSPSANQSPAAASPEEFVDSPQAQTSAASERPLTDENTQLNNSQASTLEENADSSAVAATKEDPALDLSEYCFTRYKALLSGKLTAPSKKVCHLILTFTAFPNEQKLAILPHLTKLLRKPAPIEDYALSADSKAWIEDISQLEGDNLRKLCSDPHI